MTQLYGILAFASTLIAGILLIFVEIGNTSVKQDVSKGVRMVSLSTYGLGAAVASELSASDRRNFQNSSLYGDPNQEQNVRNPGDGLRLYYSWGLWSRCAGYAGVSKPQYCTKTKIGYPLEPATALLEDVPSSYATVLGNLLNPDRSGLKTDKSYADLTKFASYAIIAGIVHQIPLLFIAMVLAAGRQTKLLAMIAAGLNLSVVMAPWMGAAMYTAMASNLKSKLNGKTLVNSNVSLGMEVKIGNGIAILWVANVILLLGAIPYVLIFLAARRNSKLA